MLYFWRQTKKNRTPSSEYIGYGLYLYFLGLSLRNVVKALSYLHVVKRSHVSIWKWIQKFRHRRILSTRRRDKISEYIVGNHITGWTPIHLAMMGSYRIEPENGDSHTFLVNKSKERNMLIAERFLSCVVRYYGNHPVSTDGGTWYPQACVSQNGSSYSFSSYEKSVIERTMQYIKDRTERFDDYFQCKLKL